MASNVLRPEEWPDLVSAIRQGDPNIGSRLADRERRFDNFFATGFYVPVVTQGATITSQATTIGRWFRIGDWAFVHGLFVANSAGTLSSNIRFSVPSELPIGPVLPAGVGAAQLINGSLSWVDVSLAPDGYAIAHAYSIDAFTIEGQVGAEQGTAVSQRRLGAGGTDQIAAGDFLELAMSYYTSSASVV